MADSALLADNAINLKSWVEQNKAFLEPPICNKSIYDNQLMVFIVGGPNQRKDYHIEEGEELFYMIKGDMCLKVVEKGQHKDVIIKQGEMFHLPAKTLHSPQRQAGTVGLVIERRRNLTEMDGVVYFVEESGKLTNSILYEKYTHCGNISRDLRPIIEQYFQSKQYHTGVPDPEDLVKSPPISPDNQVELEKPFVLCDYINEKREEIQKNGRFSLYGENNVQFKVDIHGKDFKVFNEKLETLLWVLEGNIELKSGATSFQLNLHDMCLVPENKKCEVTCTQGSLVLLCCQQPPETTE